MYNLKNIMLTAWNLYRKNNITFAEALHRAWMIAKSKPENERRIEDAKKRAGITEDIKTWFGWKLAGYMVKHESKNLFQVELLNPAKGDGATFLTSFFGFSQVEPIPAEA